MSDLIDIQENLIETNRAIVRLTSESADHPGSEDFVEIVRTVEARRDQLVRRLRRVADSVGFAVCEYRLIPEDGRLPVAGLANTVGGFQSLYTAVYDAVKTGRSKQTNTVSAATARATELDFGYTMAGSVIVVLTVPNNTQRLIWGDRTAVSAMDTIFKTAKAKKLSSVQKRANQLGPAPIRSMFSWADAHSRHSLSAEIDVYEGETLRKSVTIRKSEFQRLANTITVMNATSVEEDEPTEQTLTGLLVGAQTKSQIFWFETDGHVIKGDSAGLITAEHTVELPQMYRVKVRKIAKVSYSTEPERSRYVLLEISPLSGKS